MSQIAGEIQLLDSDISVTITSGNNFGDPGNLNLEGGQLVGTGNVRAHLLNTHDAIVRPGAPLGTLNVEGDYSQSAAASLAIDIGDDGGAAVADRLTVTGTASLDGALVVTVQPGATFAPGTQFTILTAGAVQQAFALVVSTHQWQVSYTATEVVLTAQTGASCSSASIADLDGDCDVDWADLLLLEPCLLGGDVPAVGNCLLADLDQSGAVTLADFALLQQCASGENEPPTCGQ